MVRAGRRQEAWPLGGVVRQSHGEWQDQERGELRRRQECRPDSDGVFPETKEFLAGYWIVDVESPERADAIAAEASAAPGVGGKPLNMAIG